MKKNKPSEGETRQLAGRQRIELILSLSLCALVAKKHPRNRNMSLG
jgi:hypothetical protein